MSESKRPGFIRRSGSLLRREASLVFGWEHIKLGAHSISKQWHRASKRVCPECGRGRLFPFTVEQGGEDLKFYGCSQCDYHQAESLKKNEKSLRRLRKVAFRKIENLSPEEYETLIRKYRLGSRWLYLFSVAMMLGGSYMLMTEGAAWTFLNALAVSIFLFVQGLIASYRNWQLREKILFVPGAFWRWLRSGQWLI